MFQWDDVRVFLALLASRNLRRAADELGISLSTASRRLAALEADLGIVLFVRTPEGLVPTAAAPEVAELAQRMHRAATGIETIAASATDEPAGLVRIACVPDLADLVILPALRRLMRSYPRLRIELLAGTQVSDLTRNEADVAVRTVRPQSGEDLVVRRLRKSSFAVFASRGYLDEVGRDTPLAKMQWIALGPRLAGTPESRWLENALPDVEPMLRVADMGTLRRAAAAGLGCAVLPALFGAITPQLEQLAWGGPALPEPELYLVSHEALRNSPHVAAVWSFLVELLGERDVERDIALLREQLGDSAGRPPAE